MALYQDKPHALLIHLYNLSIDLCMFLFDSGILFHNIGFHHMEGSQSS